MREVFPAYAGMFPLATVSPMRNASFPRIRGDVPQVYVLQAKKPGFSPHTRGCSLKLAQAIEKHGVFPAYAGMFLKLNPQHDKVSCFPRIRGDVPRANRKRRQRANVFPAYAGMFRERLPHRH